MGNDLKASPRLSVKVVISCLPAAWMKLLTSMFWRVQNNQSDICVTDRSGEAFVIIFFVGFKIKFKKKTATCETI